MRQCTLKPSNAVNRVVAQPPLFTLSAAMSHLLSASGTKLTEHGTSVCRPFRGQLRSCSAAAGNETTSEKSAREQGERNVTLKKHEHSLSSSRGGLMLVYRYRISPSKLFRRYIIVPRLITLLSSLFPRGSVARIRSQIMDQRDHSKPASICVHIAQISSTSGTKPWCCRTTLVSVGL